MSVGLSFDYTTLAPSTHMRELNLVNEEFKFGFLLFFSPTFQYFKFDFFLIVF